MKKFKKTLATSVLTLSILSIGFSSVASAGVLEPPRDCRFMDEERKIIQCFG